MKNIFLLVCLGLLVWQPNRGLAKVQANNNRSDTVDVINYTINLDITDSANTQIKGNTAVKFAPKVNGVAQVDLDLLKMTIDSIRMNNAVINYAYNDTLLRCYLPNALNVTDTQVLVVYYHGVPQGDPSGWGGFYFTGGYFYNLGVGFGANPHTYGRVWHPCFDNFVERATYDFNITTKAHDRACCNGYLVAQTNNGNGTWTWTWKMVNTIPSYLACMAVSTYKVVHQWYNGMNGVIPIELTAGATDTSNMKASFLHLPNALTTYENHFGPYRWNKVGYVLVPFNAGAMEHATNIAYPRLAADGFLTSETTMAHELSHHWFGDLATCETQEDMWLNEGWASYCENLFTEDLYGRAAMLNDIRSTLTGVLRFTHIKEGGYRAVSGIPFQYTYGEHVYQKGSLVAHSLRGYMADSTFFKAVTDYLNNHQYKKTNSYELRNDMAASSGINLNDFFNDWVFSPGFPHFSVDSFASIPNGNNFDVTVYVKQKLKGAPHLYNNVPLEVTFMDAGWNRQDRTLMVSGATGSATFSLPFDPVFCGSNMNQKLNDAISSYERTVKTTGVQNYNPAFFTVTVSSLTDSAYIRIEHNWVAADSIKQFGKPYRLSTERYWKVDGILPANFQATGKIVYDGRTIANFTGGYLDNALMTVKEDSLVLLYRRNAADDWNLCSYTKAMGANTNDKTGSITIDTLKLGEYVLAMKDYTHGIRNERTKGQLTVFPNPGDESITVSFKGGENITDVALIDSLGKMVWKEKMKSRSSCTIPTKKLEAGTYTVTMQSAAGSGYSQKVIISH